jgi:hypothetical protein
MDHPKITPLLTHFAGGGDIEGNPGAGNDVYHGIAQVLSYPGNKCPDLYNFSVWLDLLYFRVVQHNWGLTYPEQVGPCGGRVLPPDTNTRYSPEPIGTYSSCT